MGAALALVERDAPSAFRAGRVIDITFTIAAVKPSRVTLFGPTLREAMTEILRGVGRKPTEITAQLLSGGRVGICERGDGWRFLLATIRLGLCADEVNGALEKLSQEGVQP